MDKLLKLLNYSELEIEDKDYLIVFKLIDNNIKLIKYSFVLENSYIKKKVIEEYYPNNIELLNIINSYKEEIDLKYNDLLELEDNITNSYIDITNYLLNSNINKKDMLLEIINFVYKYGAFNISDNYSLTTVEPFTNKVGFILVNTKTLTSINDYDSIFNTIIDEIRTRKPSFNSILDKNIKEFSRKC